MPSEWSGRMPKAAWRTDSQGRAAGNATNIFSITVSDRISTDSLVDPVESISIQMLYILLCCSIGLLLEIVSFWPAPENLHGSWGDEPHPARSWRWSIGGRAHCKTNQHGPRARWNDTAQSNLRHLQTTWLMCRDFVHFMWPGGSKTEVMTLIQKFEACIVRSLPVLLQIRPAASVASTHTLWLSQC